MVRSVRIGPLVKALKFDLLFPKTSSNMTACVWLDGSDGTDINALTRSHSERLVAVADDFCKVHLFQYPCPKPKAPSLMYDGHGSHVTNVCFTHSDDHLLSMGGKDTCILQWRVMGCGAGSRERLASTSRERLASTSRERLASTSHERLASTSHERLASTSHERLASTSHERLASTSHERLASSSSPDLKETLD
ncbi:unnamed protein product [Merluccius merluccius]